jgi:hypothetical protein
MLEARRDRAWHDFGAVDESRFYMNTDYELIWLPRDEKFPNGSDMQFNGKSAC